MRKLMTLLVAALLIQTPGAVRAADEDIFTFTLKPNVLIMIDASGSMNVTDGGAHPVSYGVDLDQNGNVECPGNECVADLDVDGIDDTRMDAALKVVLDLLDANGDGLVNNLDEDALSVRLGVMFWTSGGDNDNDPRPRTEIDYDFPIVAPLGTPYADIKKAIVDPVIAGTPDLKIVARDPRGCGATPAEFSPSSNACGSGPDGSQTRWGYMLKDTPMAEALQYAEHYFFPEQLTNDPEGSCRQNFIILITDGIADGFTPSDDVASSIYNTDVDKAHGLGVPDGFKDRNGNLIPVPSVTELPWHAKTFVVGFNGGDIALNNAIAAAGGTGAAFFETTVGGLKTALLDALSQIQVEVIALAPPPLVVPTARVGANSALYLASLTPGDTPFWEGTLTAYPLQADGTIQTDVDGKIIAIPLWEAHTELNGTTAAARNIKTVVSGTTVEDFKNASDPPQDCSERDYRPGWE